jgi:hypothetical protein
MDLLEMLGQDFNSEPRRADHSFISSEMGRNLMREVRFGLFFEVIKDFFFTVCLAESYTSIG